MPKRKHLSASQKAQIVLEAIREDKSVAQIASENSIHSTPSIEMSGSGLLYTINQNLSEDSTALHTHFLRQRIHLIEDFLCSKMLERSFRRRSYARRETFQFNNQQGIPVIKKKTMY